MRKAIPWLVATACLAALYFILKGAFPKYAGFLPFFLVLVLLDAYLWFSVKNKIPLTGKEDRKTPLAISYLVATLYWLPLMLLVSSVLTGFYISFTEWNIAWRTYLLGFIFVTYVSKFIVILFLLLADMVRMIRYLSATISKRETKTSFADIPGLRWLHCAGWFSGSAAFLVFLCGMIFWNYDFRVRKEVIVLPELPVSFDGLKIVQFSDMHLGSWACKGKLEEAIDLINQQNPDLVFFTGDIVNYTSYEVFEFADILKEIRAPLGVFAIMGNHDYGDYVRWRSARAKIENREYLDEIYKYLGWRLLLNEHAMVRKGSDSIAVIGVENWGGTRRFQRLGDIEKASQGIGGTAIRLLLTHDPSHWDQVISKKYRDINITFSGHTHGFQIGIECCGIRWSPSQYLYPTWAGLFENPVKETQPQYLYVNRGLGSVGYPGRIGILPEITLIILRKGNSGSVQ